MHRFARFRRLLFCQCALAGQLASAPVPALASPPGEAELLRRAQAQLGRLSLSGVRAELRDVGRQKLAVLAVNDKHNNEAVVALRGATIISYKPHQVEEIAPGGRGSSSKDLLWVSYMSGWDGSEVAPNRPIRGGMPWCTPWFAAHPDPVAGGPQHGFVRGLPFELVDAQVGLGGIKLRLELSHEAWRPLVPSEVWAHPLAFAMTLTVGAELRIDAQTTNLGSSPVTISEALHTYLATPNASQTLVRELDSLRYLDKLTGQQHTRRGTVNFDRAVDAVHLDVPDGFRSVLMPGRAVSLSTIGGNAVVTWNPGRGTDKSRSLPDLDPNQVDSFVCVEPGNIPGVTIPSGESHRLSLALSAHNTPAHWGLTSAANHP